MTRKIHKLLAIVLLFSLLILGGILQKQAVAHALHHAHHTAATHASILCSWMCAASHVVQSAETTLDTPLYSIDVIECFILYPT